MISGFYPKKIQGSGGFTNLSSNKSEKTQISISNWLHNRVYWENEQKSPLRCNANYSVFWLVVYSSWTTIFAIVVHYVIFRTLPYTLNELFCTVELNTATAICIWYRDICTCSSFFNTVAYFYRLTVKLWELVDTFNNQTRYISHQQGRIRYNKDPCMRWTSTCFCVIYFHFCIYDFYTLVE